MVLQAHHTTLKEDDANNIQTFSKKRRNALAIKSGKDSMRKKIISIYSKVFDKSQKLR